MSFDDRRRALAEAEARVALERAALRQQKLANRRAVHDLKPWATVAGGLLTGWWLGRGRSRSRAEAADARRAPSRAYPGHAAAADAPHAAPPAPRRPNLLGLASLALAGSRAVPIMLPLALAWIDRRYGAAGSGPGAPPPMPIWVIALRGLAPLLRR